MTIKKPKLWSYKSGAKKGKWRSKAKEYHSFTMKEFYKRQRIIKAQVQEEQEKQEYRRQSYVLTAYYDNEMFFDWRVSILNSQKSNTEDYLKKVLTNRWEKWAVGKRSEGWSFIIEAFEDEFIDKSEASKFLKENVVIWEKR